MSIVIKTLPLGIIQVTINYCGSVFIGLASNMHVAYSAAMKDAMSFSDSMFKEVA